MIDQLEYQQAHDKILSVLVEMKSQLDWYKDQTHFKESTYQKRKAWLITISNYIKASKAAFRALELEIDQSYGEGLKRGKEINDKQPTDQLKGRIYAWELLQQISVHPEALKLIMQKEQVRKVTKEMAKADFPHLY